MIHFLYVCTRGECEGETTKEEPLKKKELKMETIKLEGPRFEVTKYDGQTDCLLKEVLDQANKNLTIVICS